MIEHSDSVRSIFHLSATDYSTMRFRICKFVSKSADHCLGIEILYKNKAFRTRINHVFTTLYNPSSAGRDVFVLVDAKVKIFQEEAEMTTSESSESDVEHGTDDTDEVDSGEQVEDTWNRVQVEYLQTLGDRYSSDICFPYWISLERPRALATYVLSVMQVLNGKFVLETVPVKCEDAVEMLECFERSVVRYASQSSYVKHIREFEVDGFVDCDRRAVTLSASEFQLAS